MTLTRTTTRAPTDDKHASMPISELVDGELAYQSLIDPGKTWYNNARLAKLTVYIVILLLTSSTTGYDDSGINALQSLPQWFIYFGHPTRSKLGWMVAMLSVGAFAGTLVSPYCADMFGRKKTLTIGNVLMIMGSALQAASQSVGMFMGSRVIIGIGLTFANSGAPILIAEIAYPPYRVAQSSVYLGLIYSGSLIAAWTTYGTSHMENDWAWRIPSIVQTETPLLQVFLIWLIPESPRWLVSKGRDEEALDILAYYHGDGDRNDPLVSYEFELIKATLEVEAHEDGSYKSLFTERGNLRRLRTVIPLAFFAQISGVTLAAFYLNIILIQVGITKPLTQLLINAFLSLWNLFCAIAGSRLVETQGRRPMFLFSSITVLILFSIETICFAVYSETGHKAAANAFIVFVFLSFGALNVAFIPLLVGYTIEIFPYHTRAKGMNLFFSAVALAGIFNAEVNPIALDAIGWKLFLVYVGWLALAVLFIYLFIVETKGRTLEETAAVFDGKSEEAHQHRHAAHEKHDGEPGGEGDSGMVPNLPTQYQVEV